MLIITSISVRMARGPLSSPRRPIDMNRTVLIVDDNPDGILLMRFALERLDPSLDVEKALSGNEALERLRSADKLPALVLLDLRMPGMSGIETLQAIRGDERLKDLPVVITTLSIVESDADAALRAGASGFVRRSISIAELSEDIAQHVRRWVGR